MVLTLRAPASPTPGTAPCRSCGRRHKAWRTLAKCRWKKAIWVEGDGRWASVSLCPHSVGFNRYQATTVQLYDDRDEASRAKDRIDRLACGNSCSRQHFIFDMAKAMEDA